MVPPCPWKVIPFPPSALGNAASAIPAASQHQRPISQRPARPIDCALLVSDPHYRYFLPSSPPLCVSDTPTGCCVVRVRLSFVVAPLHLLLFLAFVVLVMLMLPFPSSLSPLAFQRTGRALPLSSLNKFRGSGQESDWGWDSPITD